MRRKGEDEKADLATKRAGAEREKAGDEAERLRAEEREASG